MKRIEDRICPECKVDFKIIAENYGRGSGGGKGSNNIFKRIYCSDKCKIKANKKNIEGKTIKLCKNCEKDMLVYPCKKETQNFCSRKCQGEFKKKQFKQENYEQANCLCCKKIFSKKKNKDIKFCSEECMKKSHVLFNQRHPIYKIGQRVKVRCEVCDKEKEITQYQHDISKYKRFYCSKKCLYIAQSNGTFPGHYNGRTGYRIDLNDGHYYKSTFEADYARYLNYIGKKFEYENYTFAININNKKRQYTPDFYIVDDKKYVECKGYINENANIECVDELKKQKNIELIYMKDFYKMLEKMNLRYKINNLEKYDYRHTKRLIIRHDQLMKVNDIENIKYEGDVIDIEVDIQPNFYTSNDGKIWGLTHNSKMPDIDNDIQKSKRQQVLAYIQKYGEQNVSQIGAYSTYTQKNAFADVARVFGIEAKESFSITKIMEDDKPITIDQIISVVCMGINGNATDDEKKYKETVREKYTKILDISKHMKGLIRHFSRHAAGVIILDKPIYEYLPVIRADEDIISAIDGDTLTAKGFLKIDLLGLDALDIISDVLNYIKRFENKNINLNKIDFEDNKVLQLFRDKDTDNIFQFDTRAMVGGPYVTKSGYKGIDKGLLGRIIPTKFEHLVHLNAINRPGALSNGIDKLYEERKEKGIKYTTPKLLEKHLKDTYGLLIFQEQVINILSDWLDINLGKADIMRKQMEKSTIKDLLNEGNYYHHLFQKYDKKEIEEALEMIQKAGGYSFNLSHSHSYSALAFQMAYLKCYYRKYFNVAILNTEGTDEKKGMPKIRKTLQDCMKNKWLKPYHLNEISYYFTFDKDGMIIPGVRILNGVGEKTIESVIANKPYRDLADFLTRANCNKTVLEALNNNGFFTNTFGKAIDVNQIREDKEKNKKKKKIVQSEQLF
jgi:hypothetical protein